MMAEQLVMQLPGIRNAHNVIQAQIKSMGAQVGLVILYTLLLLSVQYSLHGQVSCTSLRKCSLGPS